VFKRPNIPRYAPSHPFVDCAFVPGYTPDPRRQPGPGPREPAYTVEVLDPRDVWRCDRYLFGIDLWNHGYYWEAHEAWEGLWHTAGRTGAVGALLKGLIRLAAAGVKVRQGNPESVGSHGEGARLQFRNAQAACGEQTLCGLDLLALDELAERIIRKKQSWRGDPELPCEVVFDRALILLR
jgi:hypothetical protein